MKKLEESVRSIQMDGLLWGTGKLLPVAYGVKKLQITCVIEDDKVSSQHESQIKCSKNYVLSFKVSTEELEEKLVEFEDYVQSVDIVAFNKI